MGREKNFKDKINTRGFKQCPENINKNGRSKRLVGDIIIDLKENGYNAISNADINELYKILININSEDLKLMAEDQKQPIIVKVIVKAIIGGRGFEIIEKMLDRAIGKSQENIKIETVKLPQIIIKRND